MVTSTCKEKKEIFGLYIEVETSLVSMQSERKVDIMLLKRFIACTTARMRAQFFSQTAVAEWSEAELNIVSSIVGVDAELADKTQKYEAIREELESRITKAA